MAQPTWPPGTADVQALRKLTANLSKSNTVRSSSTSCGEGRRDLRLARDHAGRRALKFYASVRIDIRGSRPSRTVRT